MRLNILQRSPAQVIDGASVSTPVGRLIQPTGRSFQSLLDSMAMDEQAHALLIGGDLIDHHVNAWRPSLVERNLRAVWGAVDMDDGLSQNYRPGVDMVGIYSQIHRFCRDASKPVFGLAGNHDAYLAPFGISPRVGPERANAGIAADVNLTIYEALLAFGRTFGHAEVSVPWSHPPSSFRKEWMEWFYTVFTPFVEASVRLPRQRVVCLGWGDDEDMFFGGQGTTHLPRADKAVSDIQLKLLNNATDQARSYAVIVLSHFTVASFREDVPLRTLPPAAPGSTKVGTHGNVPATVGHLVTAGPEDEFNMGTFETNHDAFLKLLAKRKVTAVFSGHSHRRGLYFLGTPTKNLMDQTESYPVTMYDPNGFKFKADVDHRAPALIVSDSAGPYPRYNRDGELQGWGSDKPAGSIACFDAKGALREVRVVRADSASLPRLAVSIDYVDLDKQQAWWHALQLHWVGIHNETEMLLRGPHFKGRLYTLWVPLHDTLRRSGISVRTISFMVAGKTLPALQLTVQGRAEVDVYDGDNFKLFEWLKQTKVPDRFLSIVFDWDTDEKLLEQYNVDSPWNFEVSVTRVVFDEICRYELARPLRSEGWGATFPELPDFSWRESRAPQPGQGAASAKSARSAASLNVR